MKMLNGGVVEDVSNGTIIRISDWSVFPGGRHCEDSDYSACEFLENVVLPNIEERTIIDLNGTRGIASCFLDELAIELRKYFSSEKLHEFLEVRCDHDSIVTEFWRYVDKKR